MTRLMPLLLILAVWGCGKSASSNDAQDHVHDHIHSHEGKDVALSKVTAGPWTIEPTVKGEVRRGELTVIELQVEGEDADAVQIEAFVEAEGGDAIVEGVPFHRMARAGRYALHLGLPEDAPEKLTLRVALRVGDARHEAQVALP